MAALPNTVGELLAEVLDKAEARGETAEGPTAQTVRALLPEHLRAEASLERAVATLFRPTPGNGERDDQALRGLLCGWQTRVNDLMMRAPTDHPTRPFITRLQELRRA